MKQIKSLAVLVFICTILVFFSSCKRTGVQEPSPFGPSTYSILMQLSAAPNAIFAGESRESTTVTAVLKKYNGMPIANKDIHFDIRDALGFRADIGFFEGNESVKTKTTDQNGMVSVDYIGPFAQELTANTMVYIQAVVAWEGNEFIYELAPIYLIREAVDLTFTLIADPNVILATSTRPKSQLKAYFKTVDGMPLSGRKVYFKILKGLGSFANNARKTFVLTDTDGFATVTYFGPTKFEFGYDQMVTIQGQPETKTPIYDIYENIDIRLIRQE